MTEATFSAAKANSPLPRRSENVGLLLVIGLSLLTLLAWVVPGLGELLPRNWSELKFNTAFCLLLLGLSLYSVFFPPGPLREPLRQATSLLALLIALPHLLPPLHPYLALPAAMLIAEPWQALNEPMSVQTAFCVVCLALCQHLRYTAQTLQGHLLDFLILLLAGTSLVLLSGWFFREPGAPVADMAISGQAISSIILLMAIIAARRAPYGCYAVITSAGIGGQFARSMLPAALIIAYLVAFLGNRMQVLGILSPVYTFGFISALQGTLLLLVVVLMARKIQSLEENLHDLSITDELTGICNWRGLHALGEQAWHDARRSKRPLSILFFDVDGLKRINDTLGHETGSQLILDLATVLRGCFRTSDIVGRLGGDEFVVVAFGRLEDLQPALERLRQATQRLNSSGKNPYRISYSVGGASLDHDKPESFADLLDRADAEMYRDKHRKRAVPDQDVSYESPLSAARSL